MMGAAARCSGQGQARPHPGGQFQEADAPRFFGYHEVFHTLVIAGSITHFTLVAAYVFHL